MFHETMSDGLSSRVKCEKALTLMIVFCIRRRRVLKNQLNSVEGSEKHHIMRKRASTANGEEINFSAKWGLKAPLKHHIERMKGKKKRHKHTQNQKKNGSSRNKRGRGEKREMGFFESLN